MALITASTNHARVFAVFWSPALLAGAILPKAIRERKAGAYNSKNFGFMTDISTLFHTIPYYSIYYFSILFYERWGLLCQLVIVKTRLLAVTMRGGLPSRWVGNRSAPPCCQGGSTPGGWAFFRPGRGSMMDLCGFWGIFRVGSMMTGWWFQTWLLFSRIYGTIIPTDFHIFQRSRYTTNQMIYVDFSKHAT